MIRDEKLKKVNDIIFQEAEPPSDRNRPLEWRRSFNIIDLEIDKISITSGAQLNDLDILSDDQKEDADIKAFPQIKAEPKKIRYISGTVIDCDDSIHYAVEEDKEDKIYSFQKPPKPMTIQLKDCGEYIRKDDLFPNGTYQGTLLYDEYSPNSDNFHLEAQIPTVHFDDLIQALQDSTNPRLSISIALLSYSYEVDDALREYWMPRDLLIYKTAALAPVLNVFVKSKIGSSPDQEIEEDEDMQSEGINADLRTSAPNKKNKQKETLRKLSTPLWVIAFLLFLFLLK